MSKEINKPECWVLISNDLNTKDIIFKTEKELNEFKEKFNTDNAITSINYIKYENIKTFQKKKKYWTVKLKENSFGVKLAKFNELKLDNICYVRYGEMITFMWAETEEEALDIAKRHKKRIERLKLSDSMDKFSIDFTETTHHIVKENDVLNDNNYGYSYDSSLTGHVFVDGSVSGMTLT